MIKLEIGTAVVLLGLLLGSGCMQHPPTTSEKAPPIRVRLIASTDQVLVSATAPPLVTSTGEGQARRLDFPANGNGVPVTLSPSGWRIGSATFAAGELRFDPQALGSVRINGAPYRGAYRLVPVGPDRFDVINDVDIDSYLMSVVSSEMLRDWNPEAYRAQAIVARTYALYEAHTAGVGRSFDVYDDTKSQVYGGITSESIKSQQAVLDTSGVVVAYGPSGEEKIFKAYFSSCCGGVGQSATEAFGDADIPPLREKNVGALCNASPRFNWGPIVIKKDELTRRIRSWGAKKNRPEKDMGTVMRIDIAAVNHYQRPVRFVITDSRGLQYSESGEELRWACNADFKPGAPTLNSSFVKPISSPQSDEIQFVEGHGWGHAVGMCQWCAQVMAERGRRHEDIVRLSFPGAVLVRAY
jgi:stage II sporulation protein D